MTDRPWIELFGVSKFWVKSVPSLRAVFQSKSPAIPTAALNHIQWMLKPGRIVAIMGPNGAGKTTLLRILSGISAPSSGEVKIQGKIVSVLGSEGVFHPDFTIYEAIALHGSLYLMDRKIIQAKISEILEWSGLDKEKTLSSPIRTLSTGMQGRLLFSIALSARWDVLLVDEVFANLDSEYREKSIEILRSRVRLGASVAVVTHDELWAKTFCDEVFYLCK